MIELGQLEAKHEEFARRNTRVVAVSVDGPEDSARTQAKFPHVRIVSDPKGSLVETVGLVHKSGRPNGGDIAHPATFLIDRDGTVKAVLQSERYITRVPTDELLAAVDAHLARP